MAISKLGQQVIETSQKGQEALVKQAGIPSLPTTPLNAMVIGANADSAKMTGTPAQQKNAIQFSTQDQELSDIQRTDRVGVVKDDRTTNKGLTGIGSLRNRVVELTMQKIKDTQFKDSVPPNIDVEAIKGMAADEPTQKEIAALAATIQNETDSTKKLTAYSKLKSMITPEQMQKVVGMDSSTYAKSVASQLDDSFKVKDLPTSVMQDAGITIADLSSAAGVSAEDLGKLSWGELKQKVVSEQSKKFADVGELESIAFDATQPLQAKLEAQKRLRELGYTAVRGAATETATLNDRIMNEEILEVDGKKYTIDNLLDDKKVQLAIEEALINPDSLKGGPYEKLIPFVNQHRDELKAQQDKFVTAGKTLETNLASFTAATTSSADIPIPDAILKGVFTPEQIEAARKGITPLDATLIPAIWKTSPAELAKKLGLDEAGAKGRLAAVMNVIASNLQDPELGSVLKGLDLQKMIDYGFFANPDAAIASIKETNRLIKMLEDTDPDNDVQALTGLGVSGISSAQKLNLLDVIKAQSLEQKLLDINKVVTPIKTQIIQRQEAVDTSKKLDEERSSFVAKTEPMFALNTEEAALRVFMAKGPKWNKATKLQVQEYITRTEANYNKINSQLAAAQQLAARYGNTVPDMLKDTIRRLDELRNKILPSLQKMNNMFNTLSKNKSYDNKSINKNYKW